MGWEFFSFRCGCPGGVGVGAAIEKVSGRGGYGGDERIICGVLKIIAVGRALREAVELRAGDGVSLAASEAGGSGIDGWRPCRIVGAGGSEDLNIGAEVGEHDLAGGKNEQVSDVGSIFERAGRRRDQREAGAVPLEELSGRWIEAAGTGKYKDVAAGFERGRCYSKSVGAG